MVSPLKKLFPSPDAPEEERVRALVNAVLNPLRLDDDLVKLMIEAGRYDDWVVLPAEYVTQIREYLMTKLEK